MVRSAGVLLYRVTGDQELAVLVAHLGGPFWPKGSGELRSFPEIDRAEWMPVSLARTKLLKGQVPFLDRLLDAVRP